jgi:5S rRNA maturation endonuclease (ribonuclease M5)
VEKPKNMKHFLIVEGKSDKTFFEGLLKHLKVSDTQVEIFGLNETQEGLSEASLKVSLQTHIKSLSNSPKLDRKVVLGILIDADYKGKGIGIMEGGIEKRLQLVNKVVGDIFLQNPDFQAMCMKINDFKELNYQAATLEKIPVLVGCHFTNIAGQGNLETVLVELADKSKAHIANCLTAWKKCYHEKLATKLIDDKLSEELVKDFDKIWVEFCKKYDIPLANSDYEKQWLDFYKKYDILTKDQRTRAGVHTSMETIMLGRTDTKNNFIAPTHKDFFDLNSPNTDFQNLCNFLLSFK